MEEKIIINFGDIINEMNKKKIRLCFVNNNRGCFLLDKSDNLYQMERQRYSSYLDNLIKNCTEGVFDLVDNSISKNIEEWEREIWDIEKVRNFVGSLKIGDLK